jgi:hypothetical protein
MGKEFWEKKRKVTVFFSLPPFVYFQLAIVYLTTCPAVGNTIAETSLSFLAIAVWKTKTCWVVPDHWG